MSSPRVFPCLRATSKICQNTGDFTAFPMFSQRYTNYADPVMREQDFIQHGKVQQILQWGNQLFEIRNQSREDPADIADKNIRFQDIVNRVLNAARDGMLSEILPTLDAPHEVTFISEIMVDTNLNHIGYIFSILICFLNVREISEINSYLMHMYQL